MPFIHIKSLPFEENIDMANVVNNIALDFAKSNGVALEHIYTTWEYFCAGHYCKGGELAEFQPKTNFPIIVDLLIPDFNEEKKIAKMLESIADSISRQLEFPKQNVFINHRQAHSGMVFDDGEIVRW